MRLCGRIRKVEIVFMDLATKQITKEFAEHTRAPYQITFSPDGTLLAFSLWGEGGVYRCGVWLLDPIRGKKLF
jgi:WD40 repeat protein